MTASSRRGSGDASLDRSGGTSRRPARADIQGLRAVAVLTVIVAHAGFAPLAGGFVGVDVFFVISGFLISDLLFREVRRDGRISLRVFYARRARRILPAATVVTVATVLATVALASLIEVRSVIDDALWATFFAANFRFAETGVDYFAQGQAVSPLQHYWSLAVEEQFYVVWPLLLLAIVLALRLLPAGGRQTGSARRGDPLPTETTARVLVALCVLSLAWSVWTTSATPVSAYFSTPARAWELGVGALVALVGPTLARDLTPRGRGLLALTGLVAIAVACVTYTEATPFPGLAALLPVLGSAAVLLAGTAPRPDRVTPWPLRALGTAPLRLVGDWSYSLYLWHWPVLTLSASYLGREPGGPGTAVALALVLVLAGLTHRYVETPFRRPLPRVAPARSLVLYPVSAAMVLVTATGGWYYTAWAGGELGDNPAISVSEVADSAQARSVAFSVDPTVARVQAAVIAGRQDTRVPSDLSPDLLDLRDDIPGVECDYGNDSRELCPRGQPDAEKTMVVLGDSHARAWIPALERIATEAGYRTFYLAKMQCTAADVSVAAIGSGEQWDACTDFHRWADQQIEELQPDLAVVSTSPPVAGVYVDGERRTDDAEVAVELRAGYARLFDHLSEHADRVLLLKDVPKAPDDPATCLTDGRPSLGRCMFEPEDRSAAAARLSVQAAQAAGVEVVDPTDWFCWDGSCPVVVGSTLTYRDPGHITATYAAQLAAPLGRAMGLLETDGATPE